MSRRLIAIGDTSHLLCFGAVAGGIKLLNEAFGAGVGVTPTVRAEIEGIPMSKKALSLRKSAEAYSGRNQGALIDVPINGRDAAARVLVQADLHAGREPTQDAIDALEQPSSETPGASGEAAQIEALGGDDAGESESIAVAFPRGLPLLINDNAGANYAQSLGIIVEPAAVSLARLKPRLTSKQLFNLARDMEAGAGDIGAVVPGHLWYSNIMPVDISIESGTDA